LLDDKNLRYFEEKLKIFHVCVGKQYEDLAAYVKASEMASTFNQSWRQCLSKGRTSNTRRLKFIQIVDTMYEARADYVAVASLFTSSSQR